MKTGFLLRLIFVIGFLIVLPLASIGGFAQTKGTNEEKSIKFARGRSSATVKGYIADRMTTHEYKLDAKAGQTLSVQISSKRSVTICVTNHDGSSPENSCGMSYTGQLASDGEYSIIVDSKRENTSYTLTVSIQ